MLKKVERAWDNLKLFVLYNLARFLNPEATLKLETKNNDLFVKIIDRVDEAGFYVMYEYLPKFQKVRITTRHISGINVEYADANGLFSAKKFRNIIREHSNRVINELGIIGISSGKYVDINPKNAIF